MLPDIMKNATNPQASAAILKNIGMDKSFIHDTFNKYSKYASLAGLNPNSAKSMLESLTGAMENDPEATTKTPKSDKTLFKKEKYPLV